MEGCSCPDSRRRRLGNSSLQSGYKNGVRHYDKEERQSDGSMHWDKNQACTVESICKTWSTRFLGQVLVRPYSWRKQQGKNWVTVKIPPNPQLIFEQFKDILKEYQLTLSWWDIFEFLTIGKSIFVTEVVLSAFILSWRMDWFRVDMEATKDGTPSSSHQETLLVEISMTSWWLHYSSESALPQSFETKSRCRLLDKSYPEHKIKDCNSGRRSHTQSLHTVLCQQIASTELFLKTQIEYFSKGSRLHDVRQKSHSTTIGNRSSSSRLARTWLAQGNLCTTGWGQGMSEATLQGDLC